MPERDGDARRRRRDAGRGRARRAREVSGELGRGPPRRQPVFGPRPNQPDDSLRRCRGRSGRAGRGKSPARERRARRVAVRARASACGAARRDAAGGRNVSVVDRASGRGLVGLAASDFKIFEDGAEQHVEHFESAEAPFDLLLLLDLSGSTARVTDTIRAAARRFVAATRTQDRVAIVTFAGETSIVSPPTSDRAALAAAIDRIAPPKGDTRLYDSLSYALDYMKRSADPARRRAVILMSDGLDSTLPNVTGVGSTLPYEELRSRVQEFEGIVYTVWTSTEYEAFSPQDIQPETFDLAHDRLEELAQAGGGAFYEVEKLEDLAGAYERVVADLGTVYSLSYRPTNKQRDGRWRVIRVTLPRHNNAVARGKRGYFARGNDERGTPQR
ncbi:MAG: hypothetical protein DMF66_13305 [Acidobacteria bacterium]|nr:MAG: hypothetical protein DMF66_13305 [Acidobacteriota bacterium]